MGGQGWDVSISSLVGRGGRNVTHTHEATSCAIDTGVSIPPVLAVATAEMHPLSHQIVARYIFVAFTLTCREWPLASSSLQHCHCGPPGFISQCLVRLQATSPVYNRGVEGVDAVYQRAELRCPCAPTLYRHGGLIRLSTRWHAVRRTSRSSNNDLIF